MISVIEHQSGQIFSIKTFRPLWIFPWTSSIWRQFPMKACLATVSYQNKQAAELGHQDLDSLLNKANIENNRGEPLKSIEAFAKVKTGKGVKSYRIYNEDIEQKMTIKVTKNNV